ncbi:MAG: helix-turn-helix domain-containing protein [Haloferacaceae archaeon]
MPHGIRATVRFATPDVCPVVELSTAVDAAIESVDATVCVDGAAGVTEFSMPADADPAVDADVTPVFSHGSTRRYRYTHDGGVTCPCECLGRFGCPVARYAARNGALTLAFHAADYDQLRAVVADLRDRFPDVDVRRLIRSPAPVERSADAAVVDRGKLTDRQREVLTTAYEMGYFERPRRANATEVAAALDIAPSTFREHLSVAETKVFEDLL